MAVDQAQVDAAMRAKLGLPAGAVPAKPVPVATPTKAATPAASEDATPAISPEVEALKSQIDAIKQAHEQMAKMNDHLMGELAAANRRKEEDEDAELTLPSAEDLENLPPHEAIAKVATVLAEKKTRALERKLMGGLGRMATDLIQLRNSAEEGQLRAAFPNLDLEKYRLKLDAKRVEMPGVPASDLIRLVADPRDLLPAEEGEPSRTQAVHMETGRPASRGGAPSRQAAQGGLTDDELRTGIVQARAAGNEMAAREYIMQMLKNRPDVPASTAQRGTGG